VDESMQIGLRRTMAVAAPIYAAVALRELGRKTRLARAVDFAFAVLVASALVAAGASVAADLF
jgi:hypothetical protein